MDAWRATCDSCEWQTLAADEKYIQGAAEVHGRLKPGHTGSVAFEPGGWVR